MINILPLFISIAFVGPMLFRAAYLDRKARRDFCKDQSELTAKLKKTKEDFRRLNQMGERAAKEWWQPVE